MFRLVRFILWLLSVPVLSLRYRVDVKGLEAVRGLRKTLIIPNHPGYIDPLLVYRVIHPTLEPRPLVFAPIFRSPLWFWLPKVMHALAVPNLETHSATAREQARQAIDGIVEALNRGDNFIMWPAGRVYRRDREVLGGNRALAEILHRVPEANVVAIRTRGLWGSLFTFGRTGSQPKALKVFFTGAPLLIANLFVLAPRRRVEMTLQRFDRHTLPELTREALNPFFENWYNTPGPEPPTYVPYHFLFGPRTYDFPAIVSTETLDLSAIPRATRDAVRHLLEEKLGRSVTSEEWNPATRLEMLGLDSIDRMEVSLDVERRFGFSSDHVPEQIGGLLALAQGLAKTGTVKPPPPKWSRPRSGSKRDASDRGRIAVLGDTIPKAFVRRALASRADVVGADDLSGVLAYERFLVGALVMARRFRDIPSPNLGLMLPASIATDLALHAMHLAGKLPVLMNWTTGPANLAHAAQLMSLTHVVTSKRFVDRTGVTVSGVEYLFLEDVRASVGRLELLTTLLRTKFASPDSLLPPGEQHADHPAVVLFTSGSEKAPKAVPLTHRNILSNLEGVLKCIAVYPTDALLGFLPTFHSFGLTVTSLLPILAGVRVVHHPDPTDAAGLARKIAAYRATILCGTPTFVGAILDRATPADLESLRLIVVGAEKCPAALFDRCRAMVPKAVILEGYGITECSPLVSANRPDLSKADTVGLPIPGVDVTVVDPDTMKPLPVGAIGMLLVSGPNIFPGYIGEEGPSPFHTLDGKRWYITGDLVTIDEDRFIRFRGRLKRFLKAGGEMISLPALEEPFAQKFPSTEEGPRVAVEGIETPEGRRIVLFTTEPLSFPAASALLRDHGFHGVMRIDEVRQVERIPVLGTGKTDYKVLRAQIESP
jgi:long-chain-fatty-acid--[acyl-carrier-protein] ligase